MTLELLETRLGDVLLVELAMLSKEPHKILERSLMVLDLVHLFVLELLLRDARLGS